jgi:hypothetical protein
VIAGAGLISDSWRVVTLRGSMSAVTDTPRPVVRWDLPVLGALAVLTFAVIPIGLTTIYGGLPAHPLFLHVPVIFIPLATLGGLAVAARPRWYENWAGAWIGGAAVVALGSLNLTMSAGDKLRAALGLEGDGPGVAHLISEHADAAGTLRIFTIAFVALYLVTLAVHATAHGQTSGVAAGDRIFAAIRRVPAAGTVLRVITAALALACLFYVYRTGDLGAKAVWLSRLHGAR